MFNRDGDSIDNRSHNERSPAGENTSFLSNWEIGPRNSCMLIKSPFPQIIQLGPYRAFPINMDGYECLRTIGDGIKVQDLLIRLSAFSETAVDNLVSFLLRMERKGLLTRKRHLFGRLAIKIPSVAPPLERIFVEATRMCNLKCLHCYMSNNDKGINADQLGRKDLTNLISDAEELGVYKFDFTGGEFFLRKDAFELLNAAKTASMSVAVFTNGTLVNDEVAKRMEGLGNIRAVYISLDDIDSTRHDSFRGSEGAHRRTISGIRALRKRNLRVVVNTTILPTNINQLHSIFNYCTQNLGTEVRFAPMISVGRAKVHSNIRVTYKDAARALHNLCLKTGTELFKLDDDRDYPECGIGHSMLFVKTNGEVCLCPTMGSNENRDFMLGKLGERSLHSIWEKSDFLAQIRSRTMEKDPSNASSKNTQGCRSRAYLQTGEIYGIDPFIEALQSCYKVKQGATQ